MTDLEMFAATPWAYSCPDGIQADCYTAAELEQAWEAMRERIRELERERDEAVKSMLFWRDTQYAGQCALYHDERAAREKAERERDELLVERACVPASVADMRRAAEMTRQTASEIETSDKPGAGDVASAMRNAADVMELAARVWERVPSLPRGLAAEHAEVLSTLATLRAELRQARRREQVMRAGVLPDPSHSDDKRWTLRVVSCWSHTDARLAALNKTLYDQPFTSPEAALDAAWDPLHAAGLVTDDEVDHA